jgi:PKD repeat protein
MKHLFLFTLLFSLFSADAQNTAIPFGMSKKGVFSCGTTTYMQSLHQKYPQLPDEAAFEAWLQQKMAIDARLGNSSRNVLTIPVIFHVIHSGEAIGIRYNLPQIQLNSQIEVLNEDFRRMMATPGYNTDSVGADVEIEFCLALLDPAGNPLSEPGIHRIDATNRGWGATPYDSPVIENSIKPTTIWNPNWYYNVWVMNTNFTGGYTQFPAAGIVPGVGLQFGETANTDGSVLSGRYVGRVGNLAPGTSGRGLTHHAGHFLGLIHTWGHSESCSNDDYCEDTPLQETFSTATCDTAKTSCGSVDMVRNYMSAASDACQNIFTQCQKNRMRTVLRYAPRRSSLLTSPVCTIPTAAPIADFIIDTIRCNGTYEFKDVSQNAPFQWFWSFGDGTSSNSQNPVHTFSQAGTYTIRLIANNMLGSHAISRQLVVEMSPSATLQLSPMVSVCANKEILLNASIADPQASYRWKSSPFLSDTTIPNPVFYSTRSLSFHRLIAFATDSTGCTTRDTILIETKEITPIDAGNDTTIQPGTSITLRPNRFGHTFSNWNWSPFFGFLSSNLIINPTVQPNQTVTYRLTAADNQGCPSMDSVKIIVWGTNPLSIDGSLNLTWGEIYPPFPNPASRELHFSANLKQENLLSLSLIDLQGRQLEQLFHDKVSPGSFSISWQRKEMFPAGLYFVRWRVGNNHWVQKIQLR